MAMLNEKHAALAMHLNAQSKKSWTSKEAKTLEVFKM